MSRYFNEIYCGSPQQLVDDFMVEATNVVGLDGYQVCREGFAIRPDGIATYGSSAGPHGYRMIGPKSKRKYLHRAIAEAFIPNPDNLPMVRHLNDDPTDNRVENLAWGTQTDNMQDCIRNGNFGYFTDEDRERAMQKRRTPVTVIFPDGYEKEYISQQEAARQIGISQSDIANCLSGKQKTSHGYRFRRAYHD